MATGISLCRSGSRRGWRMSPMREAISSTGLSLWIALSGARLDQTGEKEYLCVFKACEYSHSPPLHAGLSVFRYSFAYVPWLARARILTVVGRSESKG